MMKVYDGIYFIPGRLYDSNVIFLKGDVNVIVDTGTGSFLEYLISEIRKCVVDIEDIDWIVDTHCHHDHTGANYEFKKKSNAKIAIHEKDLNPLQEGDQRITGAWIFGQTAVPVEVERTLNEGDVLKLGNYDFEVIHAPGHTIGCICLYNAENQILISGDVVFSHGGIGRVDTPTGDSSQMKESIRRLTELDVELLLPGHGPSVSEDAEEHILRSYRMAEMFL